MNDYIVRLSTGDTVRVTARGMAELRIDIAAGLSVRTGADRVWIAPDHVVIISKATR